jgi:hypothetical protein
MALLSFCGFDTPSLPAQGEQRRSSYFNIPRGNSGRDQADDEGDAGANRGHDQNCRHRAGNSMPLKVPRSSLRSH